MTIQVEQHGYREYYIYVRHPDRLVHQVWGFFESVSEAMCVVDAKLNPDWVLLEPLLVEEFDLLKKINSTRGRTGNER